MNSQINFTQGQLKPLTADVVKEISQWEYPSPYSPYSIKGHNDEYLMDSTTWGIEQFYLSFQDTVIGQVSCQVEDSNLWVGWSMAPELCGKGYGADFVNTCVSMLRQVTKHNGPILLRVAAWNQRAIKAYEKAGFRYIKTIQDEIAYSNHIEDFWVMKLN